MNTRTPERIALDDAIATAAGVVRLAEKLTAETGLRVTQQMVSNWRMRGAVPFDYLPAIEHATGIRCERFNDSVTWERKRGRVVGYRVRLAA